MMTNNIFDKGKGFSLSLASFKVKTVLTLLFLFLLPTFAHAAANLASDDLLVFRSG